MCYGPWLYINNKKVAQKLGFVAAVRDQLSVLNKPNTIDHSIRYHLNISAMAATLGRLTTIIQEYLECHQRLRAGLTRSRTFISRSPAYLSLLELRYSVGMCHGTQPHLRRC